jgi:hypothetical protein
MNFDIRRSYFKDGSQIRTKWSSLIGLLLNPIENVWAETKQDMAENWPDPPQASTNTPYGILFQTPGKR